jgi:hypothetical protein
MARNIISLHGFPKGFEVRISYAESYSYAREMLQVTSYEPAGESFSSAKSIAI